MNDGGVFRVLTVVDGFTCRRLMPMVDTSLSGVREVCDLDTLVCYRGQLVDLLGTAVSSRSAA